MSTKTKNKKPAAKAAPRAAKAAKTKPAPKPKESKPAPDAGAEPKRRHEKILGHSACAVVRALGQAGVKVAEADAIMRAHGVEMSRASIGVQLGFGRNKDTWAKRGEPAPLDGAQIAQLRNAERTCADS